MTAALLLALASAVLHAGWNLVMKASADRFVAVWMIMAAGGLAALPVLLVTGLPDSAAWIYLGASGAIHVGYAIALAAAYDRADISVAYPLARGLAPAMAAVGGVLFLGDAITGFGWAGILTITVALTAVAVRSGLGSGTGYAALTAALIAMYTIVDSGGVRRIDDAGRYVLALFVVASLALTLTVMATRSLPDVARAVKLDWGKNLAGGIASLVAYGLVLAAVQLAPVGIVAAARETSVVFGAVGGWMLFGEDMGATRTVAASVVVIGVALLTLA